MNDLYFMKEALKLAEKAFKKGEVPVGALVVSTENSIIGKGYNQVISKKSQFAHAEIIALQKAARYLGDWRLNKCVLYVTLQPCAMCFSAAALSRIERVIYGASSPLFGFDLDNSLLPDLYKKHVKTVISGVMEAESAALLRAFFKQKRKKSEQQGTD